MIWLVAILATAILLYRRVDLVTASIILVIAVAAGGWVFHHSFGLWALLAVVLLLLNYRSIRQLIISDSIFPRFKQVVPRLSDTEQQAIDAGSVGFEGELLSGKPDWGQLMSIPHPRLTEEEQAFMDGPVDTVCSMVNDWQVTHVEADLPKKVWDYLKAEGFFALIIPKQYGGKEFSAYAHARILAKLNSVSTVLGVTVSVPNSLGPAELILHYGTDHQREKSLALRSPVPMPDLMPGPFLTTRLSASRMLTVKKSSVFA